MAINKGNLFKNIFRSSIWSVCVSLCMGSEKQQVWKIERKD